MKLKKIEVGKTVKVSINYNSVSSSMSITAEIEEGDDIKEVKRNLSKMVDDFIKQDIINQVSNIPYLGG